MVNFRQTIGDIKRQYLISKYFYILFYFLSSSSYKAGNGSGWGLTQLADGLSPILNSIYISSFSTTGILMCEARARGWKGVRMDFVVYEIEWL